MSVYLPMGQSMLIVLIEDAVLQGSQLMPKPFTVMEGTAGCENAIPGLKIQQFTASQSFQKC
ncbi:hypothetical protein IC575_004974 [Cucumis melo]